MTRCDILIQARAILPQDPEKGLPGHLTNGAAIAVGDGRVLAVGAPHELLQQFAPAEHIALGNAMLMPGLVNAHTHSAMTLLRGAADDMPLMEWLTTRIWPLEGQLNKELVHLGSLLACAEMLRTGTTCFLDMYFHQRQTARAVDQSGMRAVLAEGLLAFPTLSYANSEEAFALIEGLLADFADHPRISLALAAHTVHTATRAQLERSRDLARKHDALWFTHCAESEAENQASMKDLGQRPLAFLDSLGLLTPDTALVHMLALEDNELELVAERGCQVILCPRSNMKLASGIARTQDMLAAGIRPALGTDGAASNNALNMFQEMASCALLGKVREMDASALPAQSVLNMATINASQCLKIPGLGSLTPGAPADIIALDLDAPNLQPLHNPESQVVYAASGHEVKLTMVDGQVLYREGRYTHLDYAGLLEEMESVTAWAKEHLQQA